MNQKTNTGQERLPPKKADRKVIEKYKPRGIDVYKGTTPSGTVEKIVFRDVHTVHNWPVRNLGGLVEFTFGTETVSLSEEHGFDNNQQIKIDGPLSYFFVVGGDTLKDIYEDPESRPLD